MVEQGEADIAGSDAVSWRHMTRTDPWTGNLRLLDWTSLTPGGPFITGHTSLSLILGACLAKALRAPPRVLPQDLNMIDLVTIDRQHYLAVVDPAHEN